MKKVISLLLVAIMLLSCSVVANAMEATKFIKQSENYFLTEDGRLYCLTTTPDKFLFVDNDVKDMFGQLYVKGNTIMKHYSDYDRSDVWSDNFEVEIRRLLDKHAKFQGADGVIYTHIGATDYFYQVDGYITDTQAYTGKVSDTFACLTDKNKLYLNGGELVSDNVAEFYKNGYDMYYRTLDGNLYKNGNLILENCSNVWTEYYAKTNDGRWYHWGNNSDEQIEPFKNIDGQMITPKEYTNPVFATEYIYKSNDYAGNSLIWKIDESLWFTSKDGESSKVADRINCITSNTASLDRYFVDNKGNLYTLKGNTFKSYEAGWCVENLNDNNYCHINNDGGISYIDSYGNMKKITVNNKYINCSDWAVGEIDSADNIGYIDSVKYFDMSSNIKREDFCNMIVDFCETYLGRELSTTSNPFGDTQNEKVIKAYANGIITGVSGNEFAPDNEITREQMCAIMTRASKFLKPDVQFGEGIKFSDMNQVSDWAVEGVNAMSGLGIVKGDGYSITPQSNTSVEQAIAMTYRLYNKIK